MTRASAREWSEGQLVRHEPGPLHQVDGTGLVDGPPDHCLAAVKNIGINRSHQQQIGRIGRRPADGFRVSPDDVLDMLVWVESADVDEPPGAGRNPQSAGQYLQSIRVLDRLKRRGWGSTATGSARWECADSGSGRPRQNRRR